MRLADKSAIVTGAGRGIGRVTAIRFAQEGADVLVPDLDRKGAEETAAEIRRLGRKAVPLQMDVTRMADIQRMVETALREFGKIDILICNHGICEFGGTWDITEEQWDAMLDTNLKGYWLTVKYVVPQMIAQKTGGRIIMTSSTAGLKGMTGLAHYSASKWGIIGLAKTLALEVGAFGITVNTIHPTGVDTPMVAGLAEISGMTKEQMIAASAVNTLPVAMVEAQDIANAALWLASDDARYVTGQELKVDAGMMLK